jgi:hypothetical protein
MQDESEQQKSEEAAVVGSGSRPIVPATDGGCFDGQLCGSAPHCGRFSAI